MRRRVIYQAEYRGGLTLYDLQLIVDDARKLDIYLRGAEPIVTLNRPTSNQRGSRISVIRKIEFGG